MGIGDWGLGIGDWGLGAAMFCERGVLFGVDDGFVDSVPASGGDTPIVGGILVAVDANLRSLYFFVGIDTHSCVCFYCLTF